MRRNGSLSSSPRRLFPTSAKGGAAPGVDEIIAEFFGRENPYLAERRPTVEVWPIQLTDRLPILPVPLLEPDPDVPCDLGIAVASVYELGAYASQIDYGQPPPPPSLYQAEADWLAALLHRTE